jgi:hypothetical protein
MKENYASRFKFYSGIIAGSLLGAFITLLFVQQKADPGLMKASLFDIGSKGPVPVACGLTKMPSSDNTRGLIESESEYTIAVNAFQAANPQNPIDSVTWGGMIGKEYLMAVINSVGTDANISFKFATDNSMHKTSVFFVGGNFDPVTGNPGTNKLFVRTGIAPESFCPVNCR